MSTKDTTYNGWTNYETWNVKLWIDNEEGSYNYWKEIAQEVYDEARPNALLPNQTKDEAFVYALSKRLQIEHEEQSSGLLESNNMNASVWADLLGAALSEVNWYEIAQSYLDEVDKTDESEDAE